MDSLVQEAKMRYDAGDNAGVLSLLSGVRLETFPEEVAAHLFYFRAAAAYKVGEVLQAGMDFQQAYARLSAVSDPVMACWIAISKGLHVGRMGSPSKASSILASAYLHYQPSGVQLAFLNWHWGWFAYKANDSVLGRDRMREALKTLQALQSPEIFAVMVDLAYCELTSGELFDARLLIQEAEPLRARASHWWKAQYDRVAAEVELACGLIDNARKLATRAYEEAVLAGNKEEQGRALLLLARIARSQDGEWMELCVAALQNAILANSGHLVNLIREFGAEGR